MVLELTDKNTGEVETVKETNMITNAVNHLLGINPAALWHKTSGEYDASLLRNDNMLPICPNMIGGILLFSKTLTEDADNIYPSSDNLPVAYAGNRFISAQMILYHLDPESRCTRAMLSGSFAVFDIMVNWSGR